MSRAYKADSLLSSPVLCCVTWQFHIYCSPTDTYCSHSLPYLQKVWHITCVLSLSKFWWELLCEVVPCRPSLTRSKIYFCSLKKKSRVKFQKEGDGQEFWLGETWLRVCQYQFQNSSGDYKRIQKWTVTMCHLPDYPRLLQSTSVSNKEGFLCFLRKQFTNSGRSIWRDDLQFGTVVEFVGKHGDFFVVLAKILIKLYSKA